LFPQSTQLHQSICCFCLFSNNLALSYHVVTNCQRRNIFLKKTSALIEKMEAYLKNMERIIAMHSQLDGHPESQVPDRVINSADDGDYDSGDHSVKKNGMKKSAVSPNNSCQKECFGDDDDPSYEPPTNCYEDDTDCDGNDELHECSSDHGEDNYSKHDGLNADNYGSVDQSVKKSALSHQNGADEGDNASAKKSATKKVALSLQNGPKNIQEYLSLTKSATKKIALSRYPRKNVCEDKYGDDRSDDDMFAHNSDHGEGDKSRRLW